GGEADLRRNCHRNSVELAVSRGIVTIAFPSISTGVYGVTIERASRIALAEIRDFLKENEGIEKVICCCFGAKDYQTYIQAAKEILGEEGSE
ncbi:MAG: macro domain-containing protein, partial [Actinomycetota bacterium]|nr:macro domain-containing protein [Actinomycetota bacterium]